MRRWLVVALMGLMVSSGAGADLAKDYAPEWDRSYNREIAMALAANAITGCGEFKHKRHASGSSEYLVYCTADGQRWRAYLVFAGTQRVQGPYPPHPMFD